MWKPLRNKYFNYVLFRNGPICIFPYVKLVGKIPFKRKNGSLCAINCLNLFKNALNSLLNKHWHGLKTSRILNCSAWWKYVSKIWFFTIFCNDIVKSLQMTTFALKLKFCIHISIKLNNLGFLKSLAHVNVCSRVS